MKIRISAAAIARNLSVYFAQYDGNWNVSVVQAMGDPDNMDNTKMLLVQYCPEQQISWA